MAEGDRDEVIARGRDTEILAHGPGLVLRRPLDGRSLAGEAAVMDWVVAHGYPCPRAVEVVPDGLVMERIEGVNMLDDILAHPWRVRSHATLLADLHGWLHRLPVPDGLATPFGPGDALVHGDLHPGNVMLTAAGPLVIDWTNAARGPSGADLAVTWLLMAGADPPSSPLERVLVGAFRRLLVASFLAAADRDAAAASLRVVMAHRANDANLSPRELAAMARIVTRHAPPELMPDR
jgi:aminoglycoside phosphotransferase (APT) family kinase protein